MPRAEKVGHAFLVAPADELQRVGRIDIVLRGKGPLVDAGGPEATALRRVEIDRDLARLDDELEAWAARRRGGDRAFIAAKQRERDALAAERGAAGRAVEGARRARTSRTASSRCAAACPAIREVAAPMRKLDATIAAINLNERQPPPPAEPGRPFYVGVDKCAGCHKTAAAFWKKTVHAPAWKTLVDGGKQADYKCVGCHVTGYGEVGGTSLGHTERLRRRPVRDLPRPRIDHVAEEGPEEPPAVQRRRPRARARACHNEQHSDTFQYEAYLRDILGPGPRRERAQEAGRRPDRPLAAHRRARQAKTAGEKQKKRSTARLHEPASDADGGAAGEQLVEQLGLDVAAADHAPPCGGRGSASVVQQRGDGRRGGGLADDAQRAVGVDDGLADRDLADQRDVGEVVPRHREGALADGALEALGQRRAAVVGRVGAALVERAAHGAVRLGRRAQDA